MEIIIRPEAEIDLAEAVNYCARGGSVAAKRFVERFAQRMEFLVDNPEGAPIVYSRFRRLLLRPYSFGAFYHIADRRIFVIAVLDLREDPATIHARLEAG